MNLILTLLMFLSPVLAFADGDQPTYESRPSEKEYSKGFIQPPLTEEQKSAQKAFSSESVREQWSWNYDVSQIGKHATGFIKPAQVEGLRKAFLAGGESLAPITFRGLSGMPDVLDQGNCGSCVVAAFTAGFMWDMALRSVAFPYPLSMQHLMNCGGSAGQCSGDWGERVGARLEKLGCLVANSSYPYTARNGSCKNTTDMECYGEAGKFRTIDPSFESIMRELHDLKTIKVGVAADSRFSSYRSGIYNGFGSMNTNHYVTIVGADCAKDARDAAGKCVFNSKGALAKGNQYAYVVVLNSWGDGWGDDGFITMQFENSSGRRNNNIAGGDANAQVMDTPIEPPAKEPVTFTIETDGIVQVVTVQPKSPYSAERAEIVLRNKMKLVEGVK